MRILLLTQVLPYPPDSGPKVKTYNVLKFLAARHQVTLASFVRGDQAEEVRHLRQYCEAVHTVPMERSAVQDLRALARSLLTREPFLMVRDERTAMHQLVSSLGARQCFDVVHIDQLNMAQYATTVPRAVKVLDAHNALWLLYRRLGETMRNGPKKWLFERDWRLLKAYEGRVGREVDIILAVSEEDKAALAEAIQAPADIRVIPITVDTHEVTPVERRADADRILHVGTMFWPPNVDAVRWFAGEVFPLVRQQVPGVEFDVVGARPPRTVQALGRPGTGINVTGYVKDVTSMLERAAVMVVPVRAGGGMRVKILNALAQGLPVVTTSIGCEGIAVETGRHLLIADTPEEFAGATLHLLSNRQMAADLGRNGRQLIESNYDYRAACRPLEAIYRAAE